MDFSEAVIKSIIKNGSFDAKGKAALLLLESLMDYLINKGILDNFDCRDIWDSARDKHADKLHQVYKGDMPPQHLVDVQSILNVAPEHSKKTALN